MKEINVYIVGPPASNTEPTYLGWVKNPSKAIPFTSEVLFTPTPEGTRSIVVVKGLLHQATEAVAFYDPLR